MFIMRAMASRGTLRRWGLIGLSTAAGLGLAEAAFSARDRGAFPHLNIYRADPALGLHLRPGARQKVVFGGAPVTSVRTNREGFRGEDWPAPGGDETLVVGDSQAFGLGVEEGETLAAALGQKLGTPVRSAAVPTWGPVEYERVIARLAGERRPRRVVLVINTYNDFFEVDRPNTGRHGELDGWAVRSEQMPASATWFPGRSYLFGRSHAVYALRRWLFARSVPEPQGHPSEGTWRDLVATARRDGEERASADALTHGYQRLHEQERRATAEALAAAERDVDAQISRHLYGPHDSPRIDGARGTPGDIVDYGDGGENSRPGPLLAADIRLAVATRARAVESLRARGSSDAKVGPSIQQSLAREDASRARLAQLEQTPVTRVRALSPMTQHIERVQAIAQAAGAELVVVALPMDVQVTPAEWGKYGARPEPMEATEELLAEVVEAAEGSGARGVNPLARLRQASPGAFLPADLHLTPRGQAAVAEAIVERLGRPAAPRRPLEGLPPGRSRPPTFSEWRTTGETLLYVSSSRACVTRRVREWLGVFCAPPREMGWGIQAAVDGAPIAATLVRGGHGEALLQRWQDVQAYDTKYDPETRRYEDVYRPAAQLMLIAPVFPGDELVADIQWKNRQSRLTFRLPAEAGADPVARFDDIAPTPAAALASTPPEQALCACHKRVSGEKSCFYLPATADADCQRTHGDDCVGLLGCSSGDPAYPPRCPEGTASGGAWGRCQALCGEGRSCAAGLTCAPWQGASLCMAEGSSEQAPPRVETIAIVPVSPAGEDRARAVVLAARELIAGCQLANNTADSKWQDVHDRCAPDDALMARFVAAEAALGAHLEATPADRARLAFFSRRAALLHAVLLGPRVSYPEPGGWWPRGLVAQAAALADDWRQLRPAEPIAVHGEKLLEQYRTGARTAPLVAARPTPVWEQCRTGPCLGGGLTYY